MSNSEINTNININFTTEGIDKTIGQGRNLLLTLNSIRLSIKDIQMVMSGPTLSNVLWTAIQLTRVYTNLRRLIRSVAAEQAAAGLSQTVFGAGRFGAAGEVAKAGLLSSISAFAMANPILVGAAVGTIVVGGYMVSKHNQEEADMRDFIERQREVARSQGLEP